MGRERHVGLGHRDRRSRTCNDLGMTPYDLVLRGGRVIDPESMLDGTRDVAIDGGRVSAVSEEHVDGKAVIDVSGLVVAPGFIDLHSHAQTLAGRRLQAFDGVTTALELEAGRAPIHEAYAWDAAMGSPINYGFSTSWAAVRRRVATGVVGDGGIDSCLSVLGETAWRGPLTAEERARLVGHLSDDLAQGAVGIGVLLGYAPDVSPEEYLAVAGLAASAGVPTFTHCRDLVELSTRSKVGGAEELVRAAATTGAHMHVCHVNSTWPREIDRVLDLFERCRAEGGRVTTEAYPYGASATAIGAPFLSPEALAHRELAPSSITYLPSGERRIPMALWSSTSWTRTTRPKWPSCGARSTSPMPSWRATPFRSWSWPTISIPSPGPWLGGR
jgi:hypothetical protein